MKARWLFLPLLLVPCAAAAQEAPQAGTPTGARPCAVTLAGADLTGWKEVRATGFTFCVPGEWRSFGRARGGTDAPTWRSGSSTITWGTGNYRGKVVTTTITTVVIEGRAAGGLPSSLPAAPAAPGRVRQFSETIDGVTADLWDNEFDGVSYTGARWSTPRAVHVSGESRDVRNAALQLQIYRTVRFTRP
jgi:hypothetical protein